MIPHSRGQRETPGFLLQPWWGAAHVTPDGVGGENTAMNANHYRSSAADTRPLNILSSPAPAETRIQSRTPLKELIMNEDGKEEIIAKRQLFREQRVLICLRRLEHDLRYSS